MTGPFSSANPPQRRPQASNNFSARIFKGSATFNIFTAISNTYKKTADLRMNGE